jgi:tRNA(ile)-lysidine synthase
LQQLLFTAEAGKMLSSPSHQLIKDKEWVWLLPIEGEEEAPFLIAEGVREVTTPIRLFFEEVPLTAALSQDPNTISVDADKLEFPLALRHKREGDIFYPIGLGSAKKLSKYFIDEKYSQIARQQQWLLCSGDRIVWVVGKRLDHRFRVTPKTKRVLQISVVGNSQIC